jgi:MoaA/NifB/PqqE/SkfB family radical SAM enzyme
MQGISIMCQESKAFVYWASIVFSFNQDKINHMQDLARDQGCDGFQITHSTKFGSKYGEAYGGPQDSLEPRIEFISATHRYERFFVNLSGREQHNQTYLEHNKKLFEQVKQQHNTMITPMCQIGNRGIYVSADGVLHPCSWVSFPYTSMSTARKTIWFQDSFHQMHREKLNLHHHTLDQVLDNTVWGKLFDTFNNPNRAWVECEQKCANNLVNENYAVGWLTN